MATIRQLASVVRSKNAGPFMTTFDILFKDKEAYQMVKNSRVITKELIANLYSIPIERVYGVYFVDEAMGIKASIYNDVASGDFDCRDIYGMNQHAPLLDLEIP